MGYNEGIMKYIERIKRRGQKRYYQKLATISESDKQKSSDFLGDSHSWFDFGHIHFDGKGLGNTSWKKRLPHLECLFNHFSLYEEKLKEMGREYQLFAILYDYDSTEDALYVHTPNPMSDNFPFKPELGSTPNLSNAALAKYLTTKTTFEKLFGESENENYCILYKKGVGGDLR